MQAQDSSKQSNNALSAALKGATLAFQGQKTASDKPSPKSPNPTKTNNGAVRAAAQATRDHSISRPRSPTKTTRQELGLDRQGTGGSAQELAAGAYSRDLEHGVVVQKPSQHLAPPHHTTGSLVPLLSGTRPGPDGKKASLIAATLAASRSGSPSPNHTGQSFAQTSFTPTQLHSRVTRRRSSVANGIDLSSVNLGLHPHDTASIPPANSLISLFEGKKGEMDPVKNRDPPQPQRLASHPKIRPLTPSRSRSPEVRARDEVQEQLPSQKPKPLPQPTPKAAPQPPQLDHGVTSAQHVVRVTRPSNIDQVEVRTEVTELSRKASQQSLKLNTRPGIETHVSPPAVIPKSKSITELRVRANVNLPKPPIQVSIRPLSEVVSPQHTRAVKTQHSEPPTLLPRISSITETSTSAAQAPAISTKDVGVGAEAPEDDLINTLEHRLSNSSTSSNDTFVSASSIQTPRAQSPAKELENPKPNQPAPRRSPPAASALARSSSYKDITSPAVRSVLRRPTEPAHSSSGLALDSLTDAIMASNLASSRLARPANSQNPPPLPPPRRHHRPHSPLHAQRSADSHLRPHIGSSSGSKSPSRQPPPQRTGMLQTLRAPHTSLSDDEDARRHMHRHRKKTLGGGKKHAHHEGSRRRWRDEISARERRRYEAVWASNRGLLLKRGFGFSHPDSLPPIPDHASQDHDHGQGGESQVDQSRAWDGPEADLVVNAVVRDIWSRSRLPGDELAEVWDLVDRRGEGVLDKQEFVVGMWLIDQRLRGRKIPARVSESVWDSARGEGVRVIVPKVKVKAKGGLVKAKGPRGG
ncbi:hypothetical protein B0T22DRAFT_446634 [Podospora appendiculata]|uniref:EH domain-containing protein n=1 Tax=Podospora appendiculata TaxID=314037 RepID=A0AAE0XF33_9PEZI|nr:hypothetical protein B0T22DRAFT_446634 [Podospora appendiculata]